MHESDLPLVTFRARQTILQEGEPGAPAYLVFSGEVSLSRRLNGQSREIARLGRGDFFGELDGQLPTTATAEAIGDCTLLRLDRSLLASILHHRPEIGLALLTQLNARWQSILDSTAIAEPAPVVESPLLLSVALVNRLVHAASGEALSIAAGSKLLVGRTDPLSPENRPDFDLGSFEGGNTVSRRHAMIELRDERLWLRELDNVTNGTLVNGKRLTNDEEVEVRVGDEIRFGLVKTVVVCD